jgi:hypothetical protein
MIFHIPPIRRGSQLGLGWLLALALLQRRSLCVMTEIPKGEASSMPKAGQSSFEKALADIEAANAALTEAQAILEADDTELDAASYAAIERDMQSIIASSDQMQAWLDQQRKSSQ